MEAVQTEKYKGYDINIYYDEDSQSPREWSNVATFVCCHRRYTLGDRQDMDACIDELFDKHVNAKDIVAYFIKSRNARWVQNGTEDYDGSYDKYLEWNDGKEYFGVDDNTPDEDIAYNYIRDELTNGEKLMLVEQSGSVVMLPISMYDHSGITQWLGYRDEEYLREDVSDDDISDADDWFEKIDDVNELVALAGLDAKEYVMEDENGYDVPDELDEELVNEDAQDWWNNLEDIDKVRIFRKNDK